MRIIRASEVNNFLYCQRSWQYRLKGVQPANIRELNSGTQMHDQHGRMVVGAWLLRLTAFVLVSAALILIILFLARQ
jgi:hypothetical protein